MMPDPIAVELREVTKKFGEVTAVDQINLQIGDGEFFSLLGPSGCGKTTTLRMIGGFEMPTSGEVYISDEPQGFKPPFQRPVNTVFQSYALFPHMNIFQNVAFGLQMKKVPKDEIKTRVEDMLELVQLPGMGNRKPNQLSGGQQQRVALARALINHPRVLLLDEPLGALDLKLRKAMQLELKAIQERVGITFVYVTHDQEEALTMSNRIAVMNFGKVLQIGSAQEIYEQPQSRFVADFIGETNYMAGKVLRLDGLFAEISLDEGGKVWVTAGHDIQEGESINVAVRPEKVTFQIDSEDCSEAPRGIVKELVYLGSDTIYIVKFNQGTEVKVRNQNINTFADAAIGPGTEVSLIWPKESSKAFSPRYDD
jgi:spermidine/putrescine transport system ATP-binding protein